MLFFNGKWSGQILNVIPGLLLSSKGEMPESFKPTYQILVDIRNKLEKLSLTQAWSLRETDLYDYQRQLDKFDESRVDGNFVDSEGSFAELYVQRVCFLLIQNWRLIDLCRHYSISSDAVMPIFST